jgi:hypothetical protein
VGSVSSCALVALTARSSLGSTLERGMAVLAW